jgi:hypothetical protein
MKEKELEMQMYVEELKKALFEKCGSISEFMDIMEAIENRIYGEEELAS